MQITKNIRNDLLKRNQISALIEAEKNPNFDEMKKQISDQVGKPEENIDVYNIKGSFGSHEFKIGAYAYDSKEDLKKAMSKKKKKTEPKTEKVEKQEQESEQKEAEATKGETPSEKPITDSNKESEKAPVEERPEQEEKAVKEEKRAEEEAKEP